LVAEHSLLLGKSGLALFVLGLLIGAIIPKFRNPRMGLSTHLTAVQSGTFLLAIGVFWPALSVPALFASIIAWSLALSSWFLVSGLGLSAVTGASRILPIAGAGHRGTKFQELLVSTIVLCSSVWLLLASSACLFYFLTAG
jgi:(hydroxyamino)benzene mutase